MAQLLKRATQYQHFYLKIFVEEFGVGLILVVRNKKGPIKGALERLFVEFDWF